MTATAYDIATSRPDAAPEFSPRQQVVLQHALTLLVEGGEKALTTAGLARTASCSKESLYKWFGDRDGLLAAVVAFQASQVQFPSEAGATADAATFRAHVTAFVEALLGVLFSETSLALNRLSIGQSNTNSNRLGQLLLVRGKHMISARARAMLDSGRRHGLLKFDESEDAYQVLYGLAIRDVHIRLLLGETAGPAEKDLKSQAEVAVDRFYRLFGA
ncbi:MULTISPECIES: TetR/AcrR family transcriptional regulator [Stappiaceae]|jgi:AcrR family transcriptional regulator|uniref:Bacterial regulatory proteins, tetR family n=3 Tax=Roseibium TaxID=150830 RepID=A0A0M6Y1U9_9HYPH|nr:MULTISPECIES: TetR/AcrR family transcriptional regulator [Stappiaceae]MCR9284567.1 TetR/AcrR family transcriptional regulator [Paracoccaceae bacterium]MEC9402299.1 TetR/AcrR family transcriptional regulator [Pseudomonadota bacterium]AQQ05833.1 TetR family transcriptional regulator [Roseibium aggregatum]MBN8181973.1 TetR/AcrR family transcriptional regulator [Roseibium aggregatum]MEC9468277.1 TetR/AcrR family transcriptional regulator [Pseudomonadota bacterium]